MQLVEQGYEILGMDDISAIERAARTCYKSEDKIGCRHPEYKKPDRIQKCSAHTGGKGAMLPSCDTATCEFHSSHALTKALIESKHMAMIEFAHATVKFITNRGVTHELVRHRLCSFGQESTRYVNYGGDDIQFIRPVWCPKSILGPWPKSRQDIMLDSKEARAVREFLAACRDAEGSYKSLLNDYGWQPQQAREVLPNALKTEIVVKANFREWLHILALRAVGTTGKPHPQMQKLMIPLLAEFARRYPTVFGQLAKDERYLIAAAGTPAGAVTA